MEEQRGAFVEKEVGRLREREGEDKGLEREKRRERKERRKRREREERDEGGGEGVVLVPFEGEEGVSTDDNSVGLEKRRMESQEERGEDADQVKKRKRGKKETLEDLEAMASGLLG